MKTYGDFLFRGNKIIVQNTEGITVGQYVLATHIPSKTRVSSVRGNVIETDVDEPGFYGYGSGVTIEFIEGWDD